MRSSGSYRGYSRTYARCWKRVTPTTPPSSPPSTTRCSARRGTFVRPLFEPDAAPGAGVERAGGHRAHTRVGAAQIGGRRAHRGQPGGGEHPRVGAPVTGDGGEERRGPASGHGPQRRGAPRVRHDGVAAPQRGRRVSDPVDDREAGSVRMGAGEPVQTPPRPRAAAGGHRGPAVEG